MYCTGCGTQPAVIGRFCSSCDLRARHQMLERRRPIGGGQWQALWGISYADKAAGSKRCLWLQWGIASAVAVTAFALMV